MKLTEISVRNLPIPASGWKIYHDDALTGFGVRITATGFKAFVLTYGASRERRTLGRYPIIGLADARAEAKRILAENTLGKLRPKRMTFLDAMEQFVETRRERNRPKTVKETEALLRGYFKKLHPMTLEDIAAHHVTDITDKLSKKGLQSTASHAHTAVKTFLKWCSQRHYIASSPIAELEKPTLPAARERVLSDDELRTVWQAAGEQGGHFGAIVKLLILTGQRRTEIGFLRAEWCSLAVTCMGESPVQPKTEACESRPQNTICLPSTITKNKRTHTFPVSASAAFILRKMMEDPSAPFLFPARGQTTKPFNGWSKAKAQLDKKVTKLLTTTNSPLISSWTLHDLRRTYITNLQRLKVPLEVREALVNHVSGQSRSGVAGVYSRYEYEAEMREAVSTFDEWFAKTIATPYRSPSQWI